MITNPFSTVMISYASLALVCPTEHAKSVRLFENRTSNTRNKSLVGM